VRQLALQYPKSTLNNGPLLIYLTARDQGRGEAAVKELEQDSQLKQAKALKADGGLSEIKFHKLDITDSNSIKSLADHLKQAHGDGIDFVINNAGIALNGFGKYRYPRTRGILADNHRRRRRQNNTRLQLLQNSRSMPYLPLHPQAHRPPREPGLNGRSPHQILR
jgi:NAD(P)-dependent dehydrogenase (short-subunit alcohol dehydrogenase family)